MLALVLLFLSMIGLLWFIVRLLQNYFDTYNGLQKTKKAHVSEIQNHLKLQENMSKIQEIEKLINAQISKRLIEMEETFPKAQSQEEISGMFTENIENVLRTTLNMLKNRTSRS